VTAEQLTLLAIWLAVHQLWWIPIVILAIIVGVVADVWLVNHDKLD
jgi:hypothetical protein